MLRRFFHVLWTALPSALALACFAWFVANLTIPSSYWLELRRVRVDDAEIGVAPLTHMDLTISRPFILHWRTQIRKQDTDDAAIFTLYCGAQGEARMYPNRHYPKVINTDWWIKPNGCEMSKGTYIMDIDWSWEEFGFHRSILVSTNIFHIPPEVSNAPAPASN